jgi:alkylation response protein AidB-like acyl-CoA dehydrogenase
MKVRGVFAPTGIATPADGGYRVSGQWAFASGTGDVDWVAATCIVMDDGAPRMGSNGIPQILMAMVPAEQATFLDDWHVAGMRGTASQDFVLDDVFVPEMFAVGSDRTTGELAVPSASLPFWVSVAPGHAAVAIGIAKGALDDLLAIVADKRPTYNPLARTAEDPVFQHRIGEAAVRLDAAGAYAHRVTAEIWDAATQRVVPDAQDVLRYRAMAGFVTRECVAVVEVAFRLAGRHAIHEDSPLQRLLRDIEVAAQHVAVSCREYRLLGAVLSGEEVPPAALV